jgi:6-phosphogluconolactonase (cycloisomerase 2 family)
VGVVEWVATQTSNVATSLVQPTSIALDPNGNIHVAGTYGTNALVINNYANDASTNPMNQSVYGTFSTPNSIDSFLVKYNPSGQVV